METNTSGAICPRCLEASLVEERAACSAAMASDQPQVGWPTPSISLYNHRSQKTSALSSHQEAASILGHSLKGLTTFQDAGLADGKQIDIARSTHRPYKTINRIPNVLRICANSIAPGLILFTDYHGRTPLPFGTPRSQRCSARNHC